MTNNISFLAKSAHTARFIPLRHYEDSYEILNFYPFLIRNRHTGKVLTEFDNEKGYPMVCLHQHKCRKHRLIAEQFIPNPDPMHNTQVDHKNGIKGDYHVHNLRWTNSEENQLNRRNVDGERVVSNRNCIGERLIEMKHYGNHQFQPKTYYMNPESNMFYRKTSLGYKPLHENIPQKGSNYVYAFNTDNVPVRVSIERFRELNKL